MPPKDRINLTKDKGLMWKGRFKDLISKECEIVKSFLVEEDLYLIVFVNEGVNSKTVFYKLNKKNELTFLAEIGMTDTKFYPNLVLKHLIVENEYIYFLTSTNQTKDIRQIKILKFDYIKNSTTLIETNLYFNIHFATKLNGEYYFGFENENNKYIYKTNNFVEFTDITDSIKYNDETGNYNIISLRNSFKINEKLYSSEYVFDGKSLSRVSKTFEQNSKEYLESKANYYTNAYFNENEKKGYYILEEKNTSYLKRKIQIYNFTERGILKMSKDIEIITNNIISNLVINCDEEGNFIISNQYTDMFSYIEFYKEI